MRLAVYGASGSLGSRLVAGLAALNFECVLIGRDAKRLQETAGRVPGSEVRLAAADDSPALMAALRNCDVVVNCAPAAATALPLARAAIAAGVHYVDGAGEQHVIRQLFDELAPVAEHSRSAIITAMGFDYAIGDCLARIAADGLEPLNELIVAYAIEGPDVSANSAEAAAAGPRPEVIYRDGDWRRVPLQLDRASFDFGGELGRRQMSRYGSGEVITVPRHTKTRTIRTLITSTSLCPHPALLPLFPLLRPLFTIALRTPARALLKMRSHKVKAQSAPSAETTRRFAVVAEARSPNGRVCRAQATGGDFHTLTAALLQFGAISLARGHKPGVFSPASAFDAAAVLDAMIAQGLSWNVTNA